MSGFRLDLSFSQWRRKLTNWFALGTLGALTVIAVAPLFFIFAYVIYMGASGLNLNFFTQIPKPMGELGGGMQNAIVGSLLIVSLACVIGVPWGLSAGIYLAEYREGLTARLLRFATDLLTSVPSIVVGIFVYGLVVEPFHGYSAIAGGLALAILMVPIVARTSEEILKLLPDHIREAGLALGLPRWRVILRVVIPASRRGVMTGIMLATARIAGETAPLLFTSFSNNFGFRGFTQPTASLPVQIFNYASSQDDVWRQKAWTGALVLVLFVFVMNITTRILVAGRPFRAVKGSKHG